MYVYKQVYAFLSQRTCTFLNIRSILAVKKETVVSARIRAKFDYKSDLLNVKYFLYSSVRIRCVFLALKNQASFVVSDLGCAFIMALMSLSVHFTSVAATEIPFIDLSAK